MNLTSFIGFLAAAAVVRFGVFAHGGRADIFLDTHALILVFGGTAAAALIAFPIRRVGELANFVFMGVLFPSRKSELKVIEQILLLAQQPEPAQLDGNIWKRLHPFLAEGYLLQAGEEYTVSEYKLILQARRQAIKDRYALDAKFLTALAKFPPAFGLLGATTGMIAMMSNLGVAGKDMIGPSMAIALVATFWGIGFANLLILPLADHANRINAENARLRTIIATGLILIHQKTRPHVILEHLVSYLNHPERVEARAFQRSVIGQNRLMKMKSTIAAKATDKSESETGT